MKRIERGNRASTRRTPRATAAERRSASDDEVRSSIPPELEGLWERVKRAIKAGPRESWLEAFLRYAEEHPGEYLDSLDDQTEALIRDLERQQRQARNPAPATSKAGSAKSRTRELLAADPRIPSVELGELVAVVYRTPGGEHRHEFRHPRPRLAYNGSGLLIAGGTYRLDARGIVEAPRSTARVAQRGNSAGKVARVGAPLAAKSRCRVPARHVYADAGTSAVAKTEAPVLSSEDTFREAVERHEDSIARHAQEVRDPIWASKAEKSYEKMLGVIQKNAHFQIKDIDCRSTSCVADLKFENYNYASTEWKRIVTAPYAENCARHVINPKPADPSLPYATTAVFDCSEARHGQ